MLYLFYFKLSLISHIKLLNKIHPDDSYMKAHGSILMNTIKMTYKRRPRRPPLRRVQSVGMGVTSSIRPMRIPARARARRAD